MAVVPTEDLVTRRQLGCRLQVQIYIAAPEVLMLFSDNFDYQV